MHVGLAAELSLRTDFLRDARDLGGERLELIDHDVDRVLQLEDFALRVDGDLLREVALGDSRRHLRDVANLRREVRGEAVDVVGQVTPRAADAAHLGLPAELPFVTDLLRDARDLGGERIELIDHCVDGRSDAEELAADRATVDLEDHLLREVSARDGRDDARDFVRRSDEIRDELIDRRHPVRPRALRRSDRRALVHAAFLTDDLTDANELTGQVLVEADDVVEELAYAAEDAGFLVLEADGEIALLDRLQKLDQVLDLDPTRRREAVPFGDRNAGVERALRDRGALLRIGLARLVAIRLLAYRRRYLRPHRRSYSLCTVQDRFRRHGRLVRVSGPPFCKMRDGASVSAKIAMRFRTFSFRVQKCLPRDTSAALNHSAATPWESTSEPARHRSSFR